MTDGLFVLILLSVAAVLGCWRFIGCAFPEGGLPSPDKYGDAVKSDAIAYWRLGEPVNTIPGNTAKDDKGLQDGIYQIKTLSASPQSAATPNPPDLNLGRPGLVASGPSRTSVQVNGGYVEVSYNAALNPPANKGFSVEAWVSAEWAETETDIFRCVVASRQDTGTNKYGYILYGGPVLDPVTFVTTDPTPHWQAWLGDGTTWQMLVGPAVVIGPPTYLLLSYDGTVQPATLTLDVRDSMTHPQLSLKGATLYSPVPAQPRTSLYIGMGSPETPLPRYAFRGRLQEVAFYDKPLTAQQINDHLSAASGT